MGAVRVVRADLLVQEARALHVSLGLPLQAPSSPLQPGFDLQPHWPATDASSAGSGFESLSAHRVSKTHRSIVATSETSSAWPPAEDPA
jgi:hypothetical protein